MSAVDGGSGAVAPAVMAGLLPGIPSWRRHRAFSIVVFVLGVLAPSLWLAFSVARHASWVALGLDRRFLAELIAVIVVAVVVRLVAIGEVVIETWGAPRTRATGWASGVVALAVVAPGVIGIASAAEARHDIGRAFGDGSAGPLFDASAPITTEPAAPTEQTVVSWVPVPGTGQPVPVPTEPGVEFDESRLPPEDIPNPPPPKPSRPDSGVDPAMLADVSTILLLGGDAGPGRSGLRTDSMILISIHRPSGRAALISVPRDLERLLFPPGSALEARYPYGFDDIANAVYPRVSSNESLREAYRIEGLRPGAVAIAEGIGYSLDITIDDYVLIDMAGFVRVIDALGGVTVDVPKAVPTPGNPPDAVHTVPPTIDVGVQHMDGTTALAYVRSRKADSDYQRMRRQRSVLAALARQVGFANALSGYTSVTSALGDSLRTSLTVDEFTNLLALIGGETAIVESVGLVPPLIRPSRPNFGEIARIVGAVQLALVTGQPSGY